MEVEDLEGRTVKEAKTIYDGGVETIIVTFDDGVELNVCPSLGHHLTTIISDTTKAPWFMPWLNENKED